MRKQLRKQHLSALLLALCGANMVIHANMVSGQHTAGLYAVNTDITRVNNGDNGINLDVDSAMNNRSGNRIDDGADDRIDNRADDRIKISNPVDHIDHVVNVAAHNDSMNAATLNITPANTTSANTTTTRTTKQSSVKQRPNNSKKSLLAKAVAQKKAKNASQQPTADFDLLHPQNPSNSATQLFFAAQQQHFSRIWQALFSSPRS